MRQTNWAAALVIGLLAAFIPPLAFAEMPTTKSSDLVSGQPAWLQLESSSMIQKGEEEKVVFSLSPTADWFLCYSHPVTWAEYHAYWLKLGERTAPDDKPDHHYTLPDPLPYPKSLGDLPTDDRGVKVSLNIDPAANESAVRFNLRLASSNRAVWADYDWRPFLFAFFVDGKPFAPPKPDVIDIDRLSSIPVMLIPKGGGERRWRFQISKTALQKLLPNDKPHALTVVAAFSERDADPWSEKSLPDNGALPPEGHDGPQVMVRSNLATIKWTGKEWTGFESKP